MRGKIYCMTPFVLLLAFSPVAPAQQSGDSLRHIKFTEYNHGQISELSSRFKPDLFWFDGDWEQDAEWWGAQEIRRMILDDNKSAIINGRLAGYGDYATPEQECKLFA